MAVTMVLVKTSSHATTPRFPSTPDFVGRVLRDAFSWFMGEIDAGISVRYPGVSASQNRVMVMIDPDGTRIVDLARRAGMTKQAMSEAVDGLERHGLVERHPDPDDARAKLVKLTPAGWQAVRYGLRVALDVHDRWTGVLGEAKMQRLVRLLRELVDGLALEAEATGASEAGRHAAKGARVGRPRQRA